LKGYDYFTNERSAVHEGSIRATFTADVRGTKHQMNLWMLGQPERRFFAVDAPANRSGRDSLPGNYMELPMPTLLVRQEGEAWQRPFVAVYEPYRGADGPTITAVRPATSDGDDAAGVAACVVAGRCNIDGRPTDFSVILVQSDDPSRRYTVEGHTTQGRFSAVVIRNGNVVERYAAPAAAAR
jgi:hypothetical protein